MFLGKTESQHLEIPLFRTEQSQYLASTLGDPLIKGLTEIVEKRPPNPVVYLANFLHNYNKSKQSGSQLSSQQNEFNENQKSSHLENSSIPVKPDASAVRHDDGLYTPEGSDGSIPGEDRDEHGQSMLHFACARSHGRNGLLHLIEESGVNIGYRDELYRTARDVSLQASQPANAKDIDRFVVMLAAKGDLKAFEDLVTEGYDHILDVSDDQGRSIIEVARTRGHNNLVSFLENIQQFEENREELHQAIREGNMEKVQQLLSSADDAIKLVKTKNYYGRTALHIAILKEHEEIVEYLTEICPIAIRIGDNLERTPLHHAMGINAVETISRILIRKGAKRTVKDLKGRQPSYYFMNKADILRLQEEEEEDR